MADERQSYNRGRYKDIIICKLGPHNKTQCKGGPDIFRSLNISYTNKHITSQESEQNGHVIGSVIYRILGASS